MDTERITEFHWSDSVSGAEYRRIQRALALRRDRSRFREVCGQHVDATVDRAAQHAVEGARDWRLLRPVSPPAHWFVWPSR